MDKTIIVANYLSRNCVNASSKERKGVVNLIFGLLQTINRLGDIDGVPNDDGGGKQAQTADLVDLIIHLPH